MKQICIDASVYIASLLKQEVKHELALQVLKSLEKQNYTYLEPEIFKAEVIAGIRTQSIPPLFLNELIDNLNDLDLLEYIAIDASLSESAIEVLKQVKCRGMDSYYIAVCAQHGIPLFTFDKKQKEAAQEFGIELFKI